MKTNILLALSVVAVGTLFAAPAQAGWSVNVSIGGPIRHPAPVVVGPPVYVPPVAVCTPPPVVCPPPQPVCAPVVYTTPRYVWGRYDYDRHEHDGWFHRDRDDRRNRDDRHDRDNRHDRDDRGEHNDNGHGYDHR